MRTKQFIFILFMIGNVSFSQTSIEHHIVFTSSYSNNFELTLTKEKNQYSVTFSIPYTISMYSGSSPVAKSYYSNEEERKILKKLDRDLVRNTRTISQIEGEHLLKTITTIEQKAVCEPCKKYGDNDLLDCGYGAAIYINDTIDLLKEDYQERISNYIFLFDFLHKLYIDHSMIGKLIGDYYRFFELDYKMISQEPLIVEVYGTNYDDEEDSSTKQKTFVLDLPDSDTIYVMPRFKTGQYNIKALEAIKTKYREVVFLSDHFMFYSFDEDDSSFVMKNLMSKERNYFEGYILEESSLENFERGQRWNHSNMIASKLVSIDNRSQNYEITIELNHDETIYVEFSKDLELESFRYFYDVKNSFTKSGNYYAVEDFVFDVKKISDTKIEIHFDGPIYLYDLRKNARGRFEKFINKEKKFFIKQTKLQLELKQ